MKWKLKGLKIVKGGVTADEVKIHIGPGETHIVDIHKTGDGWSYEYSQSYLIKEKS